MLDQIMQNSYPRASILCTFIAPSVLTYRKKEIQLYFIGLMSPKCLFQSLHKHFLVFLRCGHEKYMTFFNRHIIYLNLPVCYFHQRYYNSVFTTINLLPIIVLFTSKLGFVFLFSLKKLCCMFYFHLIEGMIYNTTTPVKSIEQNFTFVHT